MPEVVITGTGAPRPGQPQCQEAGTAFVDAHVQPDFTAVVRAGRPDGQWSAAGAGEHDIVDPGTHQPSRITRAAAVDGFTQTTAHANATHRSRAGAAVGSHTPDRLPVAATTAPALRRRLGSGASSSPDHSPVSTKSGVG